MESQEHQTNWKALFWIASGCCFLGVIVWLANRTPASQPILFSPSAVKRPQTAVRSPAFQSAADSKPNERLRAEWDAAAGEPSFMGLGERSRVLSQLIFAQDFEKALEAAEFIWDEPLQMFEEQSRMFRATRAASLLLLIRSYAPAEKAFAAKRDALEAKIKAGDASLEARADWITLSILVGDDHLALAWFDEAKNTEDGRKQIRRLWLVMGEQLIRKNKRFEDYGRFVDPFMASMMTITALNGPVLPKSMGNVQMKGMEESMWQFQEQMLADVYRSMKLAQRDAECVGIAERVAKQVQSADFRARLIELSTSYDIASPTLLELSKKANAELAGTGKAREDNTTKLAKLVADLDRQRELEAAVPKR